MLSRPSGSSAEVIAGPRACRCPCSSRDTSTRPGRRRDERPRRRVRVAAVGLLLDVDRRRWGHAVDHRAGGDRLVRDGRTETVRRLDDRQRPVIGRVRAADHARRRRGVIDEARRDECGVLLGDRHTLESVDAAAVHWKVAKPFASVVWVAVAPAPVAGSTHVAGTGLAVAVMSQSLAGTRSSVPGSGVTSTYLRTVTDGAQSRKAASCSASSRCEKSDTRYTSSVVMSKSRGRRTHRGRNTGMSRFSDAGLLSSARPRPRGCGSPAP